MEYPHTTKALVQFHVSLYEIRGRKSKKRKSFSTPTSVYHCQYDSTNFLSSIAELIKTYQLTLNLLTTTIVAPPSNASK